MTVYFATDHAGFELKSRLLDYVRDELGHVVEDCGATTYDENDDYPVFIIAAAKKIAEDPKERRAIILGGSGQGEAMAANRIRGVRAAVYYGGNTKVIALSREHNDANILALGARFVELARAKEVVKEWLSVPFTHEERHERRIAQIDALV